MKKQLMMGGLAAVLALGALSQVRAEKGDGPRPGARLEKWKAELDLSDDQVAKIKDLFKARKDSMKALRERTRQDMEKLRSQVEAKASDSDLKRTLDALSKDRDEAQAAREKLTQDLKRILSPTQQAKFVLGLKERGKKMMEKWKDQRRGEGPDAEGFGEGGMDPGA